MAQSLASNSELDAAIKTPGEKIMPHRVAPRLNDVTSFSTCNHDNSKVILPPDTINATKSPAKPQGLQPCSQQQHPRHGLISCTSWLPGLQRLASSLNDVASWLSIKHWQ